MIDVVKNQERFCLELRPNRSGTLRGIHIIFGFLLFVFVPTGVVFSLLGAWPVSGFMGAELLLLYGALRLNQRASQASERLELTDSLCTVERIDPWGRQRSWQFQPQWLRVDFIKSGDFVAHLSLNSKGERLNLGHFLSPDEKSTVADHLKRALARVSMLHS
ncbi:MAG: DUF2244 domain-containing protein [Rhodospirillales bacterium]|nr:DUF2244 domain-containing protein [Rhodospirillales bacterium]